LTELRRSPVWGGT